MRSALPVLPRPAATETPPQPSTAAQHIPSIRLISATPSATGMSSEASTSMNTSWASVPSPLAPRADMEAPRKRLVLKKSKLNMLGVGLKDKEKDKGKDLSDVVRRLGGSSSSLRGGFEIYVDPTEDPDFGEILMVKKKKSRGGLDGMRWGALGEVTNVPASAPKQTMLKVKAEEKDKWWSIGRGRKDSKEKTKEKEDTKTAERSKTRGKSPEARGRFNSLDSGILLSSAPAVPTPLLTYTRAGTPTAGGLLAPPPINGPPQGTNSIALRAIRSVRSLARIGSWAQLRNTGNSDDAAPAPAKKEKAEGKNKAHSERSGEKEKEEGRKKKKGTTKKKEKPQTVRQSTSSFEVGALTASPEASKTLGRKKQSILGLGLPSTMRLPTIRGGSTTSSMGGAPPVSSRLSVESAIQLARERPPSAMSTASSLRPLSTSSGVSRTSSASSTASVRWDEERLRSIKETRKRERADKKIKDAEKAKDETEKGKKAERESRRTSEGRRRTPLSEVFPATQLQPVPSQEEDVYDYPIVTVEEATSDGHEALGKEDDAALQTPVKKARPRPVSEQLLGRSRPKGLYEPDGDGVISILDAATNDLALLINTLDLEATPGTPDMTPMRPSPIPLEKLNDGIESIDNSPTKKKGLLNESPLRKNLRASTASISSLRPYAQSRGNTVPAPTGSAAAFIAQQITPWPITLSPLKEATPPPKSTPPPAPTLRPSHKRTLTPAPAADPSPVFQPLRPARSKPMLAMLNPLQSPMLSESPDYSTVRAPSSLTFGSRSSSRAGSQGSFDGVNGSPTPSPVFKKAHGHTRKRSSLVPAEEINQQRNSLPIPPDAKRALGLAGTMGASIASNFSPPGLDADDPDSDIPDELQDILTGNSDQGSVHSVDDTLSHRPKSSSPPFLALPKNTAPALELPVFRAQLIDDEENPVDLDEGGNSSEDDTKKSFDFTGELQKLNESGASDRLSFVEQLENAFRTPAKIDLRYGFGDGFLQVDVPPMPKLSTQLQGTVKKASTSSKDILSFDNYSSSQILNTKEPTLLPGSDSLADAESDEDILLDSPRNLRNTSSVNSRPSDGQLNTGFKFGGRPEAPSEVQQESPLTLSDIIPPTSHTRSLSDFSIPDEDNSVLKSILAKAVDIPGGGVRPRLHSDSSSKRQARDDSRPFAHQRHSSGISFAGFESFEEVRRGFEFSVNRPAFYPPGATRRRGHNKQESLFSIASVSSYGHVINPGSIDPFDYGLPSLRERPSSEGLSISMSLSVDDTFSFLDRQPRRKRVESDASSFYFRAPPSSIHPYNRSHRRNDSTMSVSSQAPPISLYNRSFGAHRRNDSSTSMSSVAQSYAMHGANGGRAAWAKHRQDASVDSVSSDFSAMRLGRPGIGDKMFDMIGDQGMPLTSISASPPESLAQERFDDRSSFDSVLDDDHRPSMDDSLFDQTGHRSSMFSDSVFGYDDAHPPQGHLLPPYQFRPVSVLSHNSIHSPMKEDDTMISMLGGGHVRRRSVGSIVEASPCVRVEKRKHANFQPYEDYHERRDSPNKARIIEKPSIASTSSYQFGGERMIKAQHGLLERQSLEDSCLIADGEDITTSLPVPVFSRPGPKTRSRSSTCTTSSSGTASSSGADTPPLSSSDGSSQSGDSQSSIDLSHLNMILSNSTYPMTMTTRSRARARARGQGHRRRLSQAHVSRSSVYETIEEELSSFSNSPSPVRLVSSKKSSPTVCQPVFIVEHDTVSAQASPTNSIWDDERGIVALRKYYALKDEADNTVTESKRTWTDTPFSMFAIQSFFPPTNPAGMQALLEHSVQNYGPLPSELRPRRMRSRTSSRLSPYPQPRVAKVSSPPAPSADLNMSFASFNPPALKLVPVNPNITTATTTAAGHDTAKKIPAPFAVLSPKRENAYGLAPAARPRVPSNARRSALGWSKRSTGSSKMSSEQKENNVGHGLGQGTTMTPGESLRINRPRPRGRPTPASARPIRV